MSFLVLQMGYESDNIAPLPMRPVRPAVGAAHISRDVKVYHILDYRSIPRAKGLLQSGAGLVAIFKLF